MSASPIRMGIVGHGQIARVRHVPAIAGSEAFVLAGVANPVPVVTPEGVPAFPSLEAMLEGVAIDAVALCTPPQVRGPLARTAMAAGKHVLLEKPPAATVTEAVALLAEAGRRGVTVFAAWHSMFSAAVPRLREVLAARGVAGMRIVWKEDVAKWHPGAGWFWDPGGMGVFDPAINAFSIIVATMPEPLFVTGSHFEFEPGAHAPVRATLAFATPARRDGFSAELDFRWPDGEAWTIAWTLADGGTALLERGGARLAIDGTTAVDAADEEYPALYARFAELVRDGRSELETRPLLLAAEAFMIARSERTQP